MNVETRKRRSLQEAAAIERASSMRVLTPIPDAPLTFSPDVSLERAGPAMSRWAHFASST
jgi:hypothetical protein